MRSRIDRLKFITGGKMNTANLSYGKLIKLNLNDPQYNFYYTAESIYICCQNKTSGLYRA